MVAEDDTGVLMVAQPMRFGWFRHYNERQKG